MGLGIGQHFKAELLTRATRKGEYGDTQRQQEAGIRGERKPMWDEESEFTQIKKERYIWLRLSYYSYRWVQVFRRPFQTIIIPSEKASMAHDTRVERALKVPVSTWLDTQVLA